MIIVKTFNNFVKLIENVAIWAKYDKYPFLEPDVDFVSTFLLERPECDFLKDYRSYNITA
jgi:hypothetical protein